MEEQHGAQVEAVVVGDTPLDERREALVAATREALTNAAKFASDGGPVRLYAEIEAGWRCTRCSSTIAGPVSMPTRSPRTDTVSVSR